MAVTQVLGTTVPGIISATITAGQSVEQSSIIGATKLEPTTFQGKASSGADITVPIASSLFAAAATALCTPAVQTAGNILFAGLTFPLAVWESLSFDVGTDGEINGQIKINGNGDVTGTISSGHGSPAPLQFADVTITADSLSCATAANLSIAASFDDIYCIGGDANRDDVSEGLTTCTGSITGFATATAPATGEGEFIYDLGAAGTFTLYAAYTQTKAIDGPQGIKVTYALTGKTNPNGGGLGIPGPMITFT